MLKPTAQLLALVARRGVVPFVAILMGGLLLSLVLGIWAVGLAVPLCGGSGDPGWGYWVFSCTVALVGIGFYFILSPVAYYWLAKSTAIYNTATYLLADMGTVFLEWYLAQTLTAAKAQHGSLDHSQLIRFSKGYVRRLEGVPWLLRGVLRLLLAQASFLDAFEQAARRPDLATVAPETLAREMAPQLALGTADTLTGPSGWLFWVLAGGQVVVLLLLRGV